MSDTFEPTMNLQNAIEAEQNSTETTTTTTEDDNGTEEIPHHPNEVADGYALFSDSASLVTAISTEVLGNDPVYPHIEWEDDLESYPDIIEEADLNGQQKLALLHTLAKSTFGEKQSFKNEGYGMGWNTDGEGPPTVYDNDKVDHVPYLDVHSELSAFEHNTLEGDEVAQLENEGLDMENYGFDDSIIGPQLPMLDGERFPILFEEGDEVMEMLEMLNEIDFDSLTFCEENGELQGTPTLGGDTDLPEEDDSEADSEGDAKERYFENPELISEVNAGDIRSGDHSVTHCDSLRVIQTLLARESEGKCRSTVMTRLKERRSSLQEDDTEPETEASDEDPEDSVESDDSDDSEPSYDEIKEMFGFSDLEIDAVKYRVESGQADSRSEAANQVN